MSFEVALNDYWFEYGWGVTQSVGFKATFRLSLKEDSWAIKNTHVDGLLQGDMLPSYWGFL